MPEEAKDKEPKEREEKDLPLDARLLTDAVVEFNISRRSVGLYPPGHAVITGAIEKSYAIFQKLFALRKNITLGIAKDALVVDDLMMDKKNPVYVECALSFHGRGIAGVTFSIGLNKDELVALNELMTVKDGPNGAELSDAAKNRGIRHISLIPIDFSSFKFVEGAYRSDAPASGEGAKTSASAATDDAGIWGDYVYGMLEGTLAGGEEAEGMLLVAPPEKVAELINNAKIPEEEKPDSYDRVITSYLRGRHRDKGLKSEAVNKLFTMIELLNPDIKKHFLTMSLDKFSGDVSELEDSIREMSPESFEHIIRFFAEHSSMIPDTMKNLIGTLGKLEKPREFNFEYSFKNANVLHDIEFDKELSKLFDEDHFHLYVSDAYKKELSLMLEAAIAKESAMLAEMKKDCDMQVIDRAAAEVYIEVLESGLASQTDCHNVLTRLAEMTEEFVETGRFEDALHIYNTLYTMSLTGSHRHEAMETLQYYFKSDAFIARLIEAIRVWGLKEREGLIKICRALKVKLVTPLLDALIEEGNTGHRKYMLAVLEGIGRDVLPDAVRRLSDKRWYVTRNMLFIIRVCDGQRFLDHVRKYIKHPEPRIAIEALRTLLHFKTADSVPHMKVMLHSENKDLQALAINAAGVHRVKDAVPVLMKLLDKKDFLGTEAAYKLPVVKALGSIGDPKAIGKLEKILTSRTLLYRSHLDELKLEIYRNLSNYPIRSLGKVIETGLKSSNPEIRTVCETLLRSFDKKGTGNV